LPGRAGRGQRGRGEAVRGRGVCQSVGCAARARATPSYRLPHTMIVSAPVSDFSTRVLTDTKMLHAVCRWPGSERIFDACYRVLEAVQALTMRAQHGAACPCMCIDTHTENRLCGAVMVGGGSERSFGLTSPRTHSILVCKRCSRMS